MHYATIKPLDIANGPGIRVSLFVSGCRRKCKGCFNKEAWDFEYGEKFSWETIHEIERLLKNPNVEGLSILGGDPLEPENRLEVEALCGYVRCNTPEKSIWIWTGYSWDDVKDLSILKYVDVLVDGPFIEAMKDLRLPYCGSSNQRVINVQKSLEAGDVILWEGSDLT